MVFIINKKFAKTTLLIILAVSLIFNFYTYFQNIKLTNKYESMACLWSQFSNTSLITFIASEQKADRANRTIEIFDITKGEVIKKVVTNSQIQKLAVSYINGITGVYVKSKPFPEKGYIIRIPIQPPLQPITHWLTDYGINSVNEVFILLPAQGSPFLLILDSKLRPYFFNFDGDVDVLLKKLEFYPLPPQ